MRKTLTDLHASLSRTSAIVSAIVSATNAGMAAVAFHDFFGGPGLGDPWAATLAGAAAFACGCCLHLIYTGMLGGIPAVDRIRRPTLWPVVGVLGVFVLGFSTYANVTVTAGSDALEIHNARQIDAMLGATGRLRTLAASAGQLGPALRRNAQELARKAACEAATGCLTGVPGKGALTDALGSAAGKAATAADALEAASVALAAATPQLDAALARGDNLAVRSAFAQMRAGIPSDVLTSLAADLRGDLGIAPDGRSAAVRARQHDAIARLQSDLAAIADGLDRTSKSLRVELDGIALPERETITKARAIWMYAGSLVPQIALGVALDWVLIVIAFFMAKLRDATPKPEDDVSDISLADTRRVYLELMRLLGDLKPADDSLAPLPPTTPWDDAGFGADNVYSFPGGKLAE
jgi:hypothetical protein